MIVAAYSPLRDARYVSVDRVTIVPKITLARGAAFAQAAHAANPGAIGLWDAKSETG